MFSLMIQLKKPFETESFDIYLMNNWVTKGNTLQQINIHLN